MTDSNHIADAYILVARVNHYLVRVTICSRDELCEAEQILIARDNGADAKDETISLALDLCERDLARLN